MWNFRLGVLAVLLVFVVIVGAVWFSFLTLVSVYGPKPEPVKVEDRIVPAEETPLGTLEYTLQKGENPWTVSQKVLTDLALPKSDALVTSVDRLICQDNDVRVDEWGITGKADARHLPVGFKLTVSVEGVTALQQQSVAPSGFVDSETASNGFGDRTRTDLLRFADEVTVTG